MKTEQTTPQAANHPNSAIAALIEAAFAQIKQLGAAEESSRLFPNGVGSLDLEIGSGAEARPEIRIALRISGARVESAAGEPAAMTVRMDGDVEPLFNAEGHHIIALIAKEDLIKRAPKTMQTVQKILDDGNRSLLNAATFPDDIRDMQPETKPFHFVDIPFRDGGPVNPPLPNPPHVISKIAEFTQALKQRGGSAQERVDALSWVIHLFGDVHQPLHCIERFSELHPGGDRGGNSFRLQGNARNLHSLWDSSVSFGHGDDHKLALDILQEHSREELAADLEIASVEAWARASFTLAKKFAYGPLHENPAAPPRPNASYLKAAQKIGRRQAALGAYRLADRLRDILG